MLQADKLRNAHQLNLESVDDKVQHMQKCDQDYKELISTLEKLSSEHKMEIMVPLSKKAFMPGHLVHTGEVMVYLGDSWFVNRTVNQGIDIAKRRRETIVKELSGYQKCLDNIKNKLDMTTELEEGIVEELTEEDIKRSDNRNNARVPKPNVPKPRPAFSPEELAAFSNIKTEGITSSEEDVEEKKRNVTENRSQAPIVIDKVTTSLKSILKKRSDSVGSSDDADDESEDDITIFFSHSSNLPCHDDSLLHPGNLHRLISRKKKEDIPVEEATPPKKPPREKEKFSINSSLVEERVNPAKEARTEISNSSAQKRHVSKFKMSRNR